MAPDDAAEPPPRRLLVYNLGFLKDPRLRRILRLSGWQVSYGLPREGDTVGVWGQSPTSPRGEAMAARHGAPILRIEDAFLRSVHPGRAGGGPAEKGRRAGHPCDRRSGDVQNDPNLLFSARFVPAAHEHAGK